MTVSLRQVCQHHKVDSLSIGKHLSLRLLDEWLRRWCALEFDSSIGHTGQVEVGNSLLTVRTSKPGKAACSVLDGIVCIFVVRNKLCPGLIEPSSADVIFKFLVGLNISSATRRKLGTKAILNIMMRFICVSGWQDIVL